MATKSTQQAGVMTAGQLAAAAEVNLDTLRYYERRGLLKAPRRAPNGWRRYGHDDLKIVIFIKRAQQLGFALKEIHDLIKLRSTPSERSCARVRAKALVKLEEVDEKMRDLLAMREALEELSQKCAPGAYTKCLLLEALSN